MSKKSNAAVRQTMNDRQESTKEVEKAIAEGQPVTTVAAVEAPKPVGATKKEALPLPEGIDKLPTKSAKIRHLASLNWKTADISRSLGIRYQMVRNILNKPLKSTPAAPAAQA